MVTWREQCEENSNPLTLVGGSVAGVVILEKVLVLPVKQVHRHSGIICSELESSDHCPFPWAGCGRGESPSAPP